MTDGREGLSMPLGHLLVVRYWGTAAGRETWSVPSSNVMVVGVRHSLDHPRYRHFVTILKNTKGSALGLPSLRGRVWGLREVRGLWEE